MNDRPSIIDCTGVFFINTEHFPLASGSVLLPPLTEQEEGGYEVESRTSYNNTYFTVTFSPLRHFTREAWDEKTYQVIQYVWDKMLERGIVTGTMPTIIRGNPLDMLPK